jgi:glycosyltransferase involved in cell wall biosynthesis
VIIPTHNPDIEKLRMCLTSLPDCEIILVENPEDTSRVSELLLSLSDKRIIHLSSEIGANKARNTGARAASGDVLVFIDDDIVVPPNFVDAHVAAHLIYKPGVVGGPVELEYESSRPNWMTKDFEGYLARVDFEHTRGMAYEVFKAWPLHVPIVSANMSIRKTIFNDLGEFDENQGYSGRNILSANDELRLVSEAAEKCVPGVIMINNPVRHLISSDRCTVDYLIRRAYGQGVADFRSMSIIKPKMTRLEVFEYLTINCADLFSVNSGDAYISYEKLDRPSRMFATATFTRIRISYIQGIMSQIHG